ncbi:hypothetical protein TEA_001718 [Camellia sinensis var. sinensis]|uniref:EGF-like domain-containing protein n=1 Tax=Camellia sinensis var. sinensis TaxID=542762 RepID=A0A4S4DJV0_CAMSN|nr:hypothetical protein TEA_001718 [Camellia sinensis var. sinensis]
MQLQLQPIIMMLVQVQVQVVVVVIFSLLAATIAAAPTTIAAPPIEADLKNLGCMNSCGNLSISYPFGGKKDCYHNENFLINCSVSQPYCGDVLATNISLKEGELRIIMLSIANECYDSTVAIGCQSQCSSINGVPNDGSCSGIGFYQTSILKGIGQIDFFVNSFSKHADIMDFNPCNYAFVVEDGAFNFSTTYLQDFKPMVLMVLDWGIGDKETCEEAKKNQTSYACGQNTTCYDAEDGNGYICKCSEGYEGNVYLLDGCKS